MSFLMYSAVYLPHYISYVYLSVMGMSYSEYGT